MQTAILDTHRQQAEMDRIHDAREAELDTRGPLGKALGKALGTLIAEHEALRNPDGSCGCGCQSPPFPPRTPERERCLHPSGCAEPRWELSVSLCERHGRENDRRAAASPVHPPVDPREYHAEFDARERDTLDRVPPWVDEDHDAGITAPW